MLCTSLEEYEKQLTQRLKKLEPEVLEIYNNLRAKEGSPNSRNLVSLHNTIGSKNNIFVDSVRTEFFSPKDFIAHWYHGLCNQYGDKIYKGAQGKYQYIIIEMLRFPICKEYIELFLERTFYRTIKEKTRYKPNESLWEVWFGSNPLIWGIMLSPVFRNGKWTNDVSEIRRAKYEYWTISHIMQTGIVVPGDPNPHIFPDLQSFINMYRQVIKRLAKSPYEKEIMEFYFAYLENSSAPLETPLLIPEFRFGKDELAHKYRLDFTILNAYTRELIGFEISPQSTHMQIKGITNKTQAEMNADIKSKWEKEMDKRNEYFRQYGITTITFTDDKLTDLSACFRVILEYLEKRDKKRIEIAEQEGRLQQILNNPLY